jgi:hypothetical protein
LPLSFTECALHRPREGDHVCIGCAIKLGYGAHRDLCFAIDGKCKPLRSIPQLNGQIDDQRYLCPAIKKSPIPTELCAAPAGDWVWLFWLVWHGLFPGFPDAGTANERGGLQFT